MRVRLPILACQLLVAAVWATRPIFAAASLAEEANAFNRPALHGGAIDLKAPDWQIPGDVRRIEDGMLRGDSEVILAPLVRFPGDQQLEFDAVAQQNICDRPACDDKAGGGWDYRKGHRFEDPLFEELFGDIPGPTHFFSYGVINDGRQAQTGGESPAGPRNARETAKRFGFRFVLDEKLDEAARYGLVCFGKMSEPAYKKRGIATHGVWVDPPMGASYFWLPNETLPLVRNGQGWIMDPRYLGHLVTEIEARAREKEYWAIPMFDELWTYYVLPPVPKDKWYPQVVEADKEIREKYGFGKYGMPASHEAGDPFERIAHRRWASDKLTATWEKAHKAAKAANPDMKVMGPTEGSNGTSADIEAWAPYFDILGGQCGLGETSTFFDSVRVGAVTKTYVDLSGKAVWMMVHACVGHAPRRTPEDIREMYSQVFRVGAQGLWLMHSEFNEQELEDAMFAEPARWRAMLQLADSMRKMRLPRLPTADCAILWSSDSTNSTLWGGLDGNNDRIISAYAILGPMLRSWFHFVGDLQIERGTRKLSDYKALYIPFAPYERASVVEKIGEYVQAGGVVICTDTEAFTWNLDGTLNGQRWERLKGVRRDSQRDAVSTFTTVAPGPLPLARPTTMTSLKPGWKIAPLDDKVQVLAAFEDGSPAVTLHRYGKGKVLFFAADPLRAGEFFRIPEPLYSLATPLDKESLVKPGAPIVVFVEAVQRWAGVQMGRDIWRFTLPPYAEDPYQKEKGLCLTGNYVFDVNEPVLEPNNAQTGGTYCYSRAPDGIADIVPAGAPIPFADGKLTNRLKAYKTRARSENRNVNFLEVTPKWIVSWTGKDPAAVTFDLKSEYPLDRVRFFFAGTAPAVQASGSRDGAAWTKLSSVPEESAGKDVKDIVLRAKGAYRYVRVDFAARQAGEAFELCEVEIWAERPK
ncbi:MAG: discoidin domain-containing protein [Pirellulales bacterium]|nr:discoidin domain-containing protein [Pirellulales bacterium]